MKEKLTIAALLILILASFSLKTMHLNDPYFGGYLSRQLQTMSTIDAYVHDGIDLTRPRTNYAGWPGYMIFEFPIFQATVAWLTAFPHNSLLTATVLNLLFGTLSIFLVYAISRFWFDRRVAFYASLFFAWSPLNIMFHRSAMIDISCVFFALAAQWILLCWITKPKWWLAVLFMVTGALCVLIKVPYFLPILVLLAVQLIFSAQPLSKSRLWTSLRHYAVIIGAMAVMGTLLIYWLSITQPLVPDHGIYRHLGWVELFKPQYYFTLTYRFLQHYMNPFSALFFILGVLIVWRQQRKTVRIQLLAAPILYYVLFPDINLPHSYYSLIMIPYFAIVAGVGASWVEEALQKTSMILRPVIFKIVVGGLCAFISTMMFLSSLTSSMILPQQRYHQMAKEIGPYLSPMSYSVIYVNRQGAFALWEYLRNRPTVYLKAFFKDLNTAEITQGHLDAPLVRSAVLYALKQYGEMEYRDSSDSINVQEKIQAFDGHLRYILFYLFKDQQPIEQKMALINAKLRYQSAEWLVYELEQ